VYPIVATIIMAVAALAVCFIGWWRIGLMQLGLSVVAFWIAATPGFANWLNCRLESKFPPVNVETLPQSDVVILLGGVGADFDKPTNRILHALRIYRAGKAPLILISGGKQPWQRSDATDAKVIADRLVRLGVPTSALILETESRNTR